MIPPRAGGGDGDPAWGACDDLGSSPARAVGVGDRPAGSGSIARRSANTSSAAWSRRPMVRANRGRRDGAVRGVSARSACGLSGPDRRRLLRELRERGYQGGYTAVTDFLRDVRPPRHPASRCASRPRRANRRRSTSPSSRSSSPTSPSVARIVWLFSHGARLQPADLGALRRAPGPADRAALPHGGLRGAWAVCRARSSTTA